MNDTFLSIENATVVAGRGIRAGLRRFPQTGAGARLVTNIWSIKKMTDVSGNACSLSPRVPVLSCLLMICPWWLFFNLKQVAQVYLITDVKPPSPQLSATLLTNRAEWEEIVEFIAGHFCLSVKAPVSSSPVATHSQTRSYCVDEALSASSVGSENDEINFFFPVWSSKKLLDEGNYYLFWRLLLNPALWNLNTLVASCLVL